MNRRRFLYSLLILLACLSLLAIPFWNDRVVRHYVDKIGLHRTNTVEKLQEFEGEYKHFECDVLFSTDPPRYEVGHDGFSGIQLTPYIEFLASHPESRLWLDFKNLSEENKRLAEQVLTDMLLTNGVKKSRLIIESRDWQSLRHFSQQGYYTSYYVDIPQLNDLTDSELACVLGLVRQIACSGAVSAISFPASYYKHLRKLDIRVDMLTWEHRRWAWQLPLSYRSRKILNDERVKMILVKEKGDYHQ